MTTEQINSLIRHLLTGLGLILTVLGLTSWLGVIDIITLNLDAIVEAVMVVVGFVTTLIGFFRNKERFALLKTATMFMK